MPIYLSGKEKDLFIENVPILLQLEMKYQACFINVSVKWISFMK